MIPPGVIESEPADLFTSRGNALPEEPPVKVWPLEPVRLNTVEPPPKPVAKVMVEPLAAIVPVLTEPEARFKVPAAFKVEPLARLEAPAPLKTILL